jgi:hypothetical protein
MSFLLNRQECLFYQSRIEPESVVAQTLLSAQFAKALPVFSNNPYKQCAI